MSDAKLIKAFEELLEAAVEYVEYKHDGDPYTEDARAMSEMELDYMNDSGRLGEIKEILQEAKARGE